MACVDFFTRIGCGIVGQLTAHNLRVGQKAASQIKFQLRNNTAHHFTAETLHDQTVSQLLIPGDHAEGLLIALGVVVQHASGHCGSPVRAYKGRVRHGHFIALRV